MIGAARFLDAANELGFRLYTGVPCSYLKPFINYVIDADHLRYVGTADEGNAIAVAAGAELGGTRSVVMFQNSGLGNAVSPLSSLTHTFRIPVLVIVTHRGEPGGTPDEPQHELMGQVTAQLLEVLGVPWERFPTEEAEVDAALARAVRSMDERSKPFAFIMSKGSVEPWDLRSAPPVRSGHPDRRSLPEVEPSSSRTAMLRAVQQAAGPSDVLIATTGYTGRELCALSDRPNQLYTVGSMGCASSIGLGLALAQPKRRVIVLDGDGAALMRLGALATIGHERPANLIHVVLDNGRHESTGGQSTVTDTADLAAIAAACGYGSVERVGSPDDLAASIGAAAEGLRLVHVPIVPGVPAGLPRPSMKPPEVAARLRDFLGR
ncbi:MAG: phosphonopyruvate decarboxylase [bacterium]|nr:phosphonopyruvate decarboxylase [bacterium]